MGSSVNSHRHAPWWGLAAGFSMAAAGPAHAIELGSILAFDVGPLTLRPSASVSEMYDDNIFFLPSSGPREGDFVTTISAGLNISLGKEVPSNPWLDVSEKEVNFASLEYQLDSPFYARFSDLNALNQSVSFRNRWKGNRLTIKGSDSIHSVTSLLGGGYGVQSNVSRMMYRDDYRVEYKLTDKTEVYLNGAHAAIDYERDTPLFDSDTLKGTVGFELRALPKTFFFGEVYYGQSAVGTNRPFDNKGPHEDFVGAFVGTRGNFTPHLSALIKAGFEQPSFSDGTPVSGSPVVDASLTHRYRQRTSTTLSYSRQTSVSVQAPGVTYLSDVFRLNFNQRLGETGRLTASLTGSAEFDDYGSTGFYSNRQDTWYRMGANFSYLIRVWMSASAGYEFEKFASTGQGIIDYDVNRVTLKLAIGY
jgi:hypothetical protein